jgi:hypothetical protein
MVIVTVTGAEFSFPAALGCFSDASTVIVAPVPPEAFSEPPEELFGELPALSPLPELPEGELATLLIWEITPGVVAPSGRVMLTGSPAFTSDC